MMSIASGSNELLKVRVNRHNESRVSDYQF